jgi:hypothetical protein
MIFGFNTDVKMGNTVYHVQSEARTADLLLQTMIFVRGTCIGKHGSSYADRLSHTDFSEHMIHELLKEQHRNVLQMVREGRIDDFLRSTAEIQDTQGAGLVLQWLNQDAVIGKRQFSMRLSVTDSGKAAEGALLTCRFAHGDTPIHSQGVTEHDGTANLSIDLRGLGEQADPVLLIRAKHGDKSATRQYRLKKS